MDSLLVFCWSNLFGVSFWAMLLWRTCFRLAAAVAVSCVAPLVLGKVVTFLSMRRLRRSATKLVEIAPGVIVNVCVKGQGSPVVIFDAGLGMSGLSWHWVQSLVAELTTTVTFDRPGLGCSPPLKDGQWLRRVDLMVDWLEAIIQKLNLQGDLIIVGHSTSGMHARLLCHRQPDRVKGLVLVDTAHEGQLGKLEGNSVYNSYPPPEVTEAKLAHLRFLSNTGLLRLMYLCSGPTFLTLCMRIPPLTLFLRLLDSLGRSAAIGQRKNIDILGPHLPPSLHTRFVDEQLCPHGMAAMIAEHGSQRATMEHMHSLNLMRPSILGPRPLAVVSRDPAKGAGGRLYPAARGDAAREAQHLAFQREQAELAAAGAGAHLVVSGAGHGSLLFVECDARQTAAAVTDVVRAVRGAGLLPDLCRQRLAAADGTGGGRGDVPGGGDAPAVGRRAKPAPAVGTSLVWPAAE